MLSWIWAWQLCMWQCLDTKVWFTIIMTLGAASRRVNFRTSGKTLSSLGRKQERYVGYAGIVFGSIPASHCVSTAFQRGMTQRDAAPSIIL